ncbi:conserved hypothetical protein [Ricinus communis]|uniref:Uncharacterized protein n=1 Tax=Ricinus communis TaxID=3988 RepID=B9SB06_RICCO|nr:conserved hypothetical protein [Ricinus communis]
MSGSGFTNLEGTVLLSVATDPGAASIGWIVRNSEATLLLATQSSFKVSLILEYKGGSQLAQREAH